MRISRRSRRAFVAVAAVATVALVGVIGVASAGDDPQPIDFVHNVTSAPAPTTGAQFATGASVKTGTAICTTAPSSAANVNTDCERDAAGNAIGPHNETSIAVNPTDPSNIIGGANDYQLSLNPGGHVGETVLSRAHVTFDGGHTWSEYPLYSSSTYQATGDPAVAFDASGHAYYATLGFRFVGPANAQNPDVLVANSGDKGKTWQVVRIAAGSGVETSVGDLLDKEYVAAWGSGNAIVVFGDYRLAQKGSVASVRIYSSVTHDFGKTWTQPTLISGSLDQSFVPVPTVTSDGRIFVAFMNTSHLDPNTPDYGRDDYMVVRVSPQTGAPLTAPALVGNVIDGNYDYPWAFGRPTYQDSVFRTWAAGNITADPAHANHLAVVWSDMRNSPNFFANKYPSPYTVTTNSDVIVSESFDGGQTWTPPAALALSGDQFMPWGAIDNAGRLRIGFFDRSYDASNHLYGYTVATETAPGTFARAQVTTTLSDPTKNQRWFARTVVPAFPRATAFLGDYSNIAISPSGVVAYWTDLREPNCWALPSGCGRHAQDAYFGRTP